ncbi:hypothetical protein BGZ65_010095 [Modicella reniformis]|uniref:Domain of unknown function at the cortex 1 domain-containing protein n=1 Tax=Modicella reniformis TaxID=1440133 RepID=A0A9P6M7S7_9FUNG|nr:hypothetical protein BGZ65_010095 [Modicella reniformis]
MDINTPSLVGITNDGSEPIQLSDYFKARNRRFSFQIEGRFKREWDGQQLYFGTDFDRPVELPDGFELMLRVCKYIDPVVRASLSKDGQPWVLSPLVSSINTMAAWRPEDAKLPSPPLTPRQSMDLSRSFSVTENVSGVVSNAWGFLGKLKRGNRHSIISTTSTNDSNALGSYETSRSSSADQIDKMRSANNSPAPSEPVSISSPATPQPASLASSASSTEWDATLKKKTAVTTIDGDDMALGPWRHHLEEDTTFFTGKSSMTTAQRRKHFQSEQHRKDFSFNTDLVYGFEFFSPHMDFNTFDIRLGLSLNVRKYLNGQPVRYTCRTLDGSTVFWAVEFELVD